MALSFMQPLWDLLSSQKAESEITPKRTPEKDASKTPKRKRKQLFGASSADYVVIVWQ
jgi:hypothetical protein